MANVPLPPDTPAWRKKKVKPEDMPMSKAMQDYLEDKTSREREDQRERERMDQEQSDYKAAPYKKGGSVKSKKRVKLSDGGTPDDAIEGLPIKVKLRDKPSYVEDPNDYMDYLETKRISSNNLREGLRQMLEDLNIKRDKNSALGDEPSLRNKAKAKAEKKEEDRGYKKGGMVKVRGAGIAARGRGKGKMC